MSEQSFTIYRSLFYESIAPTPRGIEALPEYQTAMNDPQTITSHYQENSIPLVVSSSHVPWVNVNYPFFETPLGFWIGPDELTKLSKPSAKFSKFGSILVTSSSIIEAQEGLLTATRYLSQMGGKIIELIQKSDGKESAVHNSYGVITGNLNESSTCPELQLHEKEAGYNATIHVVFGQPPAHDLEQIWMLYEPSFQSLTDEHPIIGIQPREEIEELLKTPGSFCIYTKDKDQVTGFAYVTLVNKLPWLVQSYYQQKFNDLYEKALYCCPAIVGRQRPGDRTGLMIMRRMGDILGGLHKKSALVFECPNRSARYIRYHVRRMEESKCVDNVEIRHDEVTTFRLIKFK